MKINVFSSVYQSDVGPDICKCWRGSVCSAAIDYEEKPILSEIGDKYRTFGKLVSLYSAWKNYEKDSDYVGYYKSSQYTVTNNDDINELLCDDVAFQMICEPIEEEDSVKRILAKDLFAAKDIDRCLDIIKQLYPKYYLDALEYLSKKRRFLDDGFLLEKKYFDELCSFIFEVLFLLEKTIDLSCYPTQKLNVFESLGSLLFGIYIHNKEKEKSWKEGFLELEDTGYPVELMPAFKENNVAIILSSSDLFAPYLGVCIKSIINNSNNSNNYDIIVFERGIGTNNKKKIAVLNKGRKNISIRFFNVRKEMRRINFFVNSSRISQETYYGLLIPWFLPDYQKAIIMDCDMIVKQDLAELFNTDLLDNVAGGVRDVVLQGWLNDKSNDTSEYYIDTLNAKDPTTYVNGGLILLDFEKYRELVTQKLVLFYINNYQFRVVDQDIFNLLLEGRMKPLDPKWNHMIYVEGAISAAIQHAPDDAQKQYYKAKQDPGIIHYASENKPWNNPELEFAEEFWECARETPFYEMLLLRMTQANIAVQFVPPNQIVDNRSGARKIADVLLPHGTYRRKVAKKILPKGSLRWRFCKQIYFIFRPEYRPQKVNQEMIGR